MPPAVALSNYISSGILWRIFSQAGKFRGVFFTYCIINNAGRISEATMRGVGDIIFSAWFFFYLFAERISKAAMGRTGVWGHNMINMTIIELLNYNFADFSKTGISLYNINFAVRNSEAAMGGGG
jgi:hypothetical protein